MCTSNDKFNFDFNEIGDKITDTMIIVNIFVNYYNKVILGNLTKVTRNYDYEIS